MDTTLPDTASAPPAPALSRGKAWLVGGSLAGVALGSLATALVLRGPGADNATAARADEPRETIVSTMSPSPRRTASLPAPGASAAPPATPRAEPATGATPTARASCSDCGTVRAVTVIERRGEATGLGAVGGAVAGGLLGSQMGGGSGQDAMTVLGAVGGGVAGHHMERRLRSTTEYRVRVQMADGSTRTLSHPTRLAVGDAVRVDGERLVAQARPATATPTTRTAQTAAGGDEPAARPRSMADAKRL